MKFNTVIFDLDGPLLDGKLRHYQCYADALRQLNYQPLPIEQYWDLKRDKTPLIEQLQIIQAEDCYETFLELWLKTIEQSQYLQLDIIQPFAFETLTTLKSLNKKIFLATLRNNPEQLHIQLKNLNLINFFDELIVASSKENDKSAKVQSHVADYVDQCLWIGDTEVDIQSAKKLNIPVAVVCNGLRTKNFLKALNPDFIGDDLAYIKEFLL